MKFRPELSKGGTIRPGQIRYFSSSIGRHKAKIIEQSEIDPTCWKCVIVAGPHKGKEKSYFNWRFE